MRRFQKSSGITITKTHSNCEVCGTEFEYSAPNQKYCSKKCAKVADARKKKELKKMAICDWCGKKFNPGTAGRRARFCPQPAPCRAKWMAENPQTYHHTCQDCQTEFTNVSKHSKYCVPCRLKRKTTRVREDNKPKPIVDKVLKEDGTIDPYYLRRGLK
jgi:predicted nucleic acid-binding Zn ribbon protein